MFGDGLHWSIRFLIACFEDLAQPQMQALAHRLGQLGSDKLLFPGVSPAEAFRLLIEKTLANQHPRLGIEFKLIETARFTEHIEIEKSAHDGRHIEDPSLLGIEFFEDIEEVITGHFRHGNLFQIRGGRGPPTRIQLQGTAIPQATKELYQQERHTIAAFEESFGHGLIDLCFRHQQ